MEDKYFSIHPNGQGVVKSVEMFNPVKGIWQEVSTHENIRMKSGVAALDGKIYVVGGCLQTLESCYRAEVFDPLTRVWKELPDTNHARATPVLVPYRGKLYVFGGEGNSQVAKTTIQTLALNFSIGSC